MTKDSLLRVIGRAVRSAGSQEKLAQRLGVDRALISRVLAQIEAPPAKLLDALGYERVTTFRKKETQK